MYNNGRYTDHTACVGSLSLSLCPTHTIAANTFFVELSNKSVIFCWRQFYACRTIQSPVSVAMSVAAGCGGEESTGCRPYLLDAFLVCLDRRGVTLAAEKPSKRSAMGSGVCIALAVAPLRRMTS